MNVCIIFDIGKTNKKMFLFDEQFNIVQEQSTTLQETTDEDGFACEDVHALTQWVNQQLHSVINNPAYNITGINVSAYGASFVHLDKDLKLIAPLYNYLKPFDEKLQQQFYNTYGGEKLMARETASPVLGNLNSGMQLYRLKYEKPDVFASIQYSLHLPQYISFIISSELATDITSIGCHTGLWDFNKQQYHHWVEAEGLLTRFPALYGGDKTFTTEKNISCGIGLHDSSAALIPYLQFFHEPFVLVSTGTWSITLNPFNDEPLTDDELERDCLCYLTYEGKPVKASRLFSGYEHEEQTKRLAAHFNTDVNYFKLVAYNPQHAAGFTGLISQGENFHKMSKSAFGERDLQKFSSYDEAYHVFMMDILSQQIASTNLVLQPGKTRQLFVDGGFSKNEVYMNLLANAYPQVKVFAASVGQASALGAALALRSNKAATSLIELKPFAPNQ